VCHLQCAPSAQCAAPGMPAASPSTATPAGPPVRCNAIRAHAATRAPHACRMQVLTGSRTELAQARGDALAQSAVFGFPYLDTLKLLRNPQLSVVRPLFSCLCVKTHHRVLNRYAARCAPCAPCMGAEHAG
jgi:hypothetical protein